MTDSETLYRALALAVREGEVSADDARRVLSWIPWDDKREYYVAKFSTIMLGGIFTPNEARCSLGMPEIIGYL